MKTSTINLSELIPIGMTKINVTNNTADVWTTRSISTTLTPQATGSYKKHFIALPGKFRLPLRIDMTIKLDYPTFWLRVGDGHINFSSGHDTEYGRIRDIADQDSRLTSANMKEHFTFDNRIPLDTCSATIAR